MKIITKAPNESGAYPPIQEGGFSAIPDGYAIWPDGLSTETFYEHNGFIVPVFDSIEGMEFVSGYTANTEAWNEWKASLPEPAEPVEEPTTEERVAELEEQVSMLDETAIELYEANLAQEEINTAQDDALIEIFEMIGG